MLNETLIMILLSTQPVDKPIQEYCSAYEAIVYSDGFKQQINETQDYFNQALKECKANRDTHGKDTKKDTKQKETKSKPTIK
ncbi:hypothetical protein [Moraxella bovis]|uniref:Uncharacterized protein n=1 Tax=Moraxella bovis TaxID=476 RepID=A0ABY6M760_MORBO|nr:hypothetical protein [Moraxella bovis]UZA02961.1 hypothetical protein LP092_13650 [Moraxella bovis]UZA54053.1 hypothetical protein LP111_12860 [Moraxella bovis]UZA57341.1 hypothetical protein LP127_01315 [Moraxella bovis]